MRYIVTIEADPCIHGLVYTLDGECKENGARTMFNDKHAREFDNRKDADAFATEVYMNDEDWIFLAS